MGWILCHLGRHRWHHERNPEMGGAAADFEVCDRCGKERPTFGSPPLGSIQQ